MKITEVSKDFIEDIFRHPRLNILFSGGLCGWSICYPLDLIRSETQSDDLRPGKRKYNSHLDFVKQLYEQEHFIRTFYRGVFSGILKAIPINAACFLAYEEVYRLWQ